MDLITPRRCTTHYAHMSSASLTTKGSWIYLGGGSPSLSSAFWRQYFQNYFVHAAKHFSLLPYERDGLTLCLLNFVHWSSYYSRQRRKTHRFKT